MPKLSDKKLTVYDLDKLSVEKHIDALKPVFEASKNVENLKKVMAEMANKNLFEAIKNITFPTLPHLDILEKIKIPELPSLPDLNLPDTSSISLERYEPPVVIKKTKWEIEKEKREAYRTELQIQILEKQLNLVKGIQSPQYDINTGIITFMGKEIVIPQNTNLEMVCRVVLKNFDNMKRKWSWDEVVEVSKERIEDFNSKKIYTAVRAVNEKIALETTIKDFLLASPTTTVKLNPKFIAK
jgi:hypothetical protein